MPSSRSSSADTRLEDLPGPDAALRERFVQALRRAEIVTLVNEARDEGELGARFAEEICEAFDAEISFVLDQGTDTRAPRVLARVGLDLETGTELLRNDACLEVGRAGKALVLEGEDRLGIGAAASALAAHRDPEGRSVVVGVARTYDRCFDPAELSLLQTATDSLAQALARMWAAEERDRTAAEQTVLLRAAKRLNRSLDVGEILSTLCEEIAAALGAEKVIAALGEASDGYEVVGATGMPEGFIGFKHGPTEGLGSHAASSDTPRVTHAYQEEGFAPRETSALSDVRTAVAVPLRWGDRVHGFLTAGFVSGRWISEETVSVIGGFTDLAGLACANAEQHAAVRAAADRDSLTGCHNHAALKRDLPAQIERSAAEGTPMCMALVDLDDFKRINDGFGHLVGDTILRAVGDVLRGAVREADFVARYGGDEFAAIFPGLQEAEGIEIAGRIVTSLRRATMPIEHGVSASVGVAEWIPGESATELIERADWALHAAKRMRTPGAVRRASDEAPGRRLESDRRRNPRIVRDKRDAIAGRIGLKIARERDAGGAGTVAATELSEAIGADEAAVLRLAEQGVLETVAVFRADDAAAVSGARDALEGGAAGRCIRERRAVVGSLEAGEGGELAVPVIVGQSMWGAIACRLGGRPFAAEHVRLAETVADHLAGAMRGIEVADELRQALLGTAESLAAALEAKDSYTAEHARSIANMATAVGREMELDEEALDDLRYGAIFHDIGKIAIPDDILKKPGPLTAEEFEVIKRHPSAGEEILAPIPFSPGVRRIVRHNHEHWDGSGYPDGLRGPEIPIGARIVLVTDAYHAMVSDRPYRAALDHVDACAEIRANAGTQFDPGVVEAFLRVVEGET